MTEKPKENVGSIIFGCFSIEILLVGRLLPAIHYYPQSVTHRYPLSDLQSCYRTTTIAKKSMKAPSPIFQGRRKKERKKEEEKDKGYPPGCMIKTATGTE